MTEEYDNWMYDVNCILTDLCGMDASDLPDFLWLDNFQDGVSQVDVIRSFISYHMDDMGWMLECLPSYREDI